MTRAEAEALVGKTVAVWTAVNGQYAGTLVRLLTPAGSPWRAVVRVTSVHEPAVPWEQGRAVQRRGFRPGEEIEVGGTSVKASDEPGTSYLEALRAALARYEGMSARPGPMQGWLAATLAECRKAIQREEAAGVP